MPIRIFPYFLEDHFNKLSKIESILLNVNIFARLSDEFYKIYRNQYKKYLFLLKGEHMEDEAMEINLLKHLVNDIVSTNQYTLEGIANFIRMPIDAILELVSGINTNPSLILAARIIKLHSDVRRDLYNELIKKIIDDSAA